MTTLVAAGLGERREVLGAQRAHVERRGAGHDLDVLLGRAQLERDAPAGQLAGDVEQQTGREHDRALALDLGLERDAQADLHVGGTQLDAAPVGGELDAGEGLDGTAGGGDAGDGLSCASSSRETSTASR